MADVLVYMLPPIIIGIISLFMKFGAYICKERVQPYCFKLLCPCLVTNHEPDTESGPALITHNHYYPVAPPDIPTMRPESPEGSYSISNSSLPQIRRPDPVWDPQTPNSLTDTNTRSSGSMSPFSLTAPPRYSSPTMTDRIIWLERSTRARDRSGILGTPEFNFSLTDSHSMATSASNRPLLRSLHQVQDIDVTSLGHSDHGSGSTLVNPRNRSLPEIPQQIYSNIYGDHT
jgi:hypothetical protein